LHRVFNRDFTNSFLRGNLSKDMFIDNPRDHSVNYAIGKNNAVLAEDILQVKDELYIKKNELGAELAEKIKYLSIAKQPLVLAFSGQLNEPFCLTMTIGDNDKVYRVQTQSLLRPASQSAIDLATLEKRFKNVASNNYRIEGIECNALGDNLGDDLGDSTNGGLTIPFKELSALKKQAASLLNNSFDIIPLVNIAPLEKHKKMAAKPGLSMLIADEKDTHLCDLTDADVYFKLPESLKKGCNKHIELLLRHPRLIPWFPAVLIGKDYDESVRILEQVRPKRIVSNNTGIAYKAFEMGIEWIAGPFLNTTNSYALLTLKEELNCAGAFISNEINRLQIKNIRRPDNFKLLYSIYHPILMMTSRQCFFQQTVGCKKTTIEDGCMLKCKKATTITNVKGVSFAVDKQKGGYPSIYNHEQFLNVDIVSDLADLFDEFFIDLTNIGAGSKSELDKAQLIQHFENLLNGDDQSPGQLSNMVSVSTNAQYCQGL
jgi:putative protease